MNYHKTLEPGLAAKGCRAELLMGEAWRRLPRVRLGGPHLALGFEVLHPLLLGIVGCTNLDVVTADLQPMSPATCPVNFKPAWLAVLAYSSPPLLPAGFVCTDPGRSVPVEVLG